MAPPYDCSWSHVYDLDDLRRKVANIKLFVTLTKSSSGMFSDIKAKRDGVPRSTWKSIFEYSAKGLADHRSWGLYIHLDAGPIIYGVKQSTVEKEVWETYCEPAPGLEDLMKDYFMLPFHLKRTQREDITFSGLRKKWDDPFVCQPVLDPKFANSASGKWLYLCILNHALADELTSLKTAKLKAELKAHLAGVGIPVPDPIEGPLDPVEEWEAPQSLHSLARSLNRWVLSLDNGCLSLSVKLRPLSVEVNPE